MPARSTGALTIGLGIVTVLLLVQGLELRRLRQRFEAEPSLSPASTARSTDPALEERLSALEFQLAEMRAHPLPVPDPVESESPEDSRSGLRAVEPPLDRGPTGQEPPPRQEPEPPVPDSDLEPVFVTIWLEPLDVLVEALALSPAQQATLEGLLEEYRRMGEAAGEGEMPVAGDERLFAPVRALHDAAIQILDLQQRERLERFGRSRFAGVRFPDEETGQEED